MNAPVYPEPPNRTKTYKEYVEHSDRETKECYQHVNGKGLYFTVEFEKARQGSNWRWCGKVT